MIKWTFPEIENPPNGLVKPFGGFKSGDADRCADDDAIRKVVYMSVSEISKKWTMPVRDWGLAYAQFTIYFEDRFAAWQPLRALFCR